MVACSKVFWSWWVDYYAHARSFVEFFPSLLFYYCDQLQRVDYSWNNRSIKWLRCVICLVCLGLQLPFKLLQKCVSFWFNRWKLCMTTISVWNACICVYFEEKEEQCVWKFVHFLDLFCYLHVKHFLCNA
jgi:hypothetical protein